MCWLSWQSLEENKSATERSTEREVLMQEHAKQSSAKKDHDDAKRLRQREAVPLFID